MLTYSDCQRIQLCDNLGFLWRQVERKALVGSERRQTIGVHEQSMALVRGRVVRLAREREGTRVRLQSQGTASDRARD